MVLSVYCSYSAVYSVVCHLLWRGCANWPLVMLEKKTFFSNLPDDHWLGWSQLKFLGAKKCFAKPKDPIYSDSWYRFPWNIWTYEGFLYVTIMYYLINLLLHWDRPKWSYFYQALVAAQGLWRGSGILRSVFQWYTGITKRQWII